MTNSVSELTFEYLDAGGIGGRITCAGCHADSAPSIQALCAPPIRLTPWGGDVPGPKSPPIRGRV